MPELHFFVEGLDPLERTLTPTLRLRLRAVNGTSEPIHSILLRCQIMIEPARRQYAPAEQSATAALFANPERWDQTLRPFLWQQVTTLIAGFTGTTVAEVPLPCSFDFDLAATQYLDAVETGEIPMRIFFSGTAFYASEQGVQAMPIPWDLEAPYRFPARAWHDCMGAHFPDCAWLRLHRETFQRLLAARARSGHPSWDRLLLDLIDRLDAAQPSSAGRAA